jgi:hypothetical protein
MSAIGIGILSGVFMVLLWIMASAIFCCIRWPRTCLMLGATLTIAAVIGWDGYIDRYRLAHVPDALQVQRILYAQEESWGFGPGGNEAGIIVYPLPEATAESILRQGPAFFATLSKNTAPRTTSWQGNYFEWKSTPIDRGSHWQPDPQTGRFLIQDYICKYGFCIDIEEGIETEAEAILNTPGSYYAFARIGMIVVCPARRKVMYLYNG